MAFRAIRDPLA